MKKLTTVVLIFLFNYVGLSQLSLNELVLDKVNNLRDSLGLSKLALDQTLNKAAEDHAYYISTKNELSHFQKTFSKETPSERVYFYGGNRTYVGENVASVTNDSTRKIAESLFNGWYNSPGHYENMVNPLYSKMGLGVSKLKGKSVFAAQVFSSNEINLPKEFEIDKLAWGVRPSEKTCKDEPQTYETMFFANSIEIEKDTVYFFFHDLDFFKNVIKNDNDGLAIDIVLREQVPCNKENQFHVSKVFDGEMQRPIYKHDIYRKNVSNNPKKIKIKIGHVPKHLSNKKWAANVIIINDNLLCDYSWPVEVPSDVFPLIEVEPYYENAKGFNFSEKKVTISDSIHLELMYERSQDKFIPLNTEDYNVVMNRLDFFNRIRIDIFASVEGATWFNERLLDEREATARNLLFIPIHNGKNVTISKSENWQLMDKQIDQLSLKNLKFKSKPQIKSYLKRNKNETFDSLLFEQRKTHVYASIDTTLTINSFYAYHIGSKYDSTLTLEEENWNKILAENHIKTNISLNPEPIIMLRESKKVKTNLLGAASIGHTNSSPYLDSSVVEQLLNDLDEKNNKQVFNYALFLTKYWFTKYAKRYEVEGVAKTITPEKLRKHLSKLDTSIIKKDDLVKIKINTLLSGVHYYVAHNNWGPMENYFDRIVELSQQGNFTAVEALELALFCNHFHKFKQAVDLLKPFHDKNELTEDGVFVLANTATLIRNSIESEQYWSYMKTARETNERRYCNWLDMSFQIQRDEVIKRDFCEFCKN